jgi:hypothetical protein
VPNLQFGSRKQKVIRYSRIISANLGIFKTPALAPVSDRIRNRSKSKINPKFTLMISGYYRLRIETSSTSSTNSAKCKTGNFVMGL